MCVHIVVHCGAEDWKLCILKLNEVLQIISALTEDVSAKFDLIFCLRGERQTGKIKSKCFEMCEAEKIKHFLLTTLYQLVVVYLNRKCNEMLMSNS